MKIHEFYWHWKYSGNICPSNVDKARWRGMVAFWLKRIEYGEPVDWDQPWGFQ